MELTIRTLVDNTRGLLNAVRGSSIKIGQNLYEIKQQLPKEQDWGDFLRDEFDIGESFASKLMTIHKVFVLEGGVSQEAIEGIDGEKLYLAAKLEGTAEEKVSKARLLTRRDLKEEKNEEVPHEHVPVSICKVCSIRL
jgi:hypothetical protein